MRTHLNIPVLVKKLGVTELSEEVAKRIAKGLEEEGNRMVEIVGALINIHKSDYSDTRAIRDKFQGMTVEVTHYGSELCLHCQNVPQDCLYDGKNVIWESVEQVTSALRDIIFRPAPPPPWSSSEKNSAYVKKFAEHSGFLYRGERGLVSFTWGGHRVGLEEYDFAKDLNYWLALCMPDMENITGCGTGIMKAPFKGAQIAYGKQRTFRRFGPRDFIGFTEKNILAAEAPNELVNRLLVFPNVEMRMEAFIRASHMGRAHPGGPGTIEEILTILAVLSDPRNQDIPFQFDLVERQDGAYFRHLHDFLTTCFNNELEQYYNIHVGSPDTYARSLTETTKYLPMRYLWNDDLHFDERVQTPFEVTFDSMESLDLTTDQPPMDLLVNLRRFFSSIVHLSVKDPDLLDSWGDDRPLIKGTPKILKATDKLVRSLESQGRIHPNKKYSSPYRVQ